MKKKKIVLVTPWKGKWAVFTFASKAAYHRFCKKHDKQS